MKRRRMNLMNRSKWYQFSFLQPKPDPVTGDLLPLGEQVSWFVQGIIRRWLFLIVITGVTAAVWTLGDASARDWWNYAASYAAVLIEGVTAMALINQTKRDAAIIREIRRGVQDIKQVVTETLKDVQKVEEAVDSPKQ